MNKRAFDKIKQGLDEARAYLDGTADRSRYRVHYASRQITQRELNPEMKSISTKSEQTSPRTTGRAGTRRGRKPL
jgi:hypothetical protein